VQYGCSCCRLRINAYLAARRSGFETARRVQVRRLAQSLFFQSEGRFPHYPKEVPLPAVNHSAERLKALASAWFDDPLKGRSSHARPAPPVPWARRTG